MPTNLPIRGLGTAGVITDVDPFNLPLPAYSRALNVRFSDGSISRSPVMRTLLSSISFNPQFTYGIFSSSGYDTVLVASDTFQIHEYSSNGSLTDRSGSISAVSASSVPFTGTTLADVVYINRPDRVPVFRGPTDTNFADLPNWPSSAHRAVALRSYGDFLIALNTTEANGVNFPNRVRFSDIALANAVPSSWDATDTTKSAGTNDLVQMETPIVDGLSLGTNFCIYSSDQVWLMEFTGGAFIHNFRKLYSSSGVINQNCIVEAEGKHFVFDSDDIYVHDGVTKQSIADGRVKDYIFGGLDNDSTQDCFVQHNQSLNEIYFCYPSNDDLTTSHPAFSGAVNCNRAACYNYRNNTWSFMDLPHVISGTTANVNSVSTYAGSTALTYANAGGTYAAQEAGFDRHVVMVGKANSAGNASSHVISAAALYGLDLSDTGTLSQPLNTAATGAPFVERVGIDLDEAGIPLTGYKVISKIVPQVTTINTADKTFAFTFGSAILSGDVPSYSTSQTLDISSDYKLNTRQGGRYLSYKMSLSDTKDFSLSGFDLDVSITGRR